MVELSSMKKPRASRARKGYRPAAAGDRLLRSVAAIGWKLPTAMGDRAAGWIRESKGMPVFRR